jgi:kynurenine formamidase
MRRTRQSTVCSRACVAALAATAALVLGPATRVAALELPEGRLVDLTHAFDASTIYWPTSPSTFELEKLADGETQGGWYYASNSFCAPEHGGTHLDAPVHFAREGVTAEAIALERLVGPAVVIDLSSRAAADPDYRATRADLEAFEATHGRIPAGSMALLRFDWSRRWPDRKAYLGDDRPGDASNLHFPSFGEEAARFLIEERGVTLLGLDTASIDHGPSTDFPVHQVAGRHDVPALENLTNLDDLPPTGALVMALPMKIAGGSGGPVRVLALVPKP